MKSTKYELFLQNISVVYYSRIIQEITNRDPKQWQITYLIKYNRLKITNGPSMIPSVSQC